MRVSSWGRFNLSILRKSESPRYRLNVVVWLVPHKKCWTADQLARRGLDHLEKCPLCDQDEEIIDQKTVLV
jgi:hypothetical protein